MSNIETVASYYLTLNEHDQLVQTNDQPFDSEAYSRMKHGVKDDTKTFADTLVGTLCEEAPSIVYDSEAPAFVVAYEALPHAATVLTRYCLEAVNLERIKVNRTPGTLLRIHTTDYMEPYSHSSIVEREKILKNQTGILADSNLEGQRPIIVDDIRVTGSQERWCCDLLLPHADRRPSAAYVASFSGDDSSPELEGALDNADITDLHDLLPHIQDDNVEVTHKLARDLLLSTADELAYFLDRLPDNMLEDIARGIANMSSETLLPYQAQCRVILARRRVIAAFDTRN